MSLPALLRSIHPVCISTIARNAPCPHLVYCAMHPVCTCNIVRIILPVCTCIIAHDALPALTLFAPCLQLHYSPGLHLLMCQCLHLHNALLVCNCTIHPVCQHLPMHPVCSWPMLPCLHRHYALLSATSLFTLSVSAYAPLSEPALFTLVCR
jgi:hypothetical protein